MKKYLLLFLVLYVAAVCFTGCTDSTVAANDEPDDPTMFSKKSIVGIWVAIDSKSRVLYYYDIKSNSHLHYVEYDSSTDDDAWAYYGEDGYMHTTNNIEWNVKGDMTYNFDESEQVIRCTKGTLWGMSVSTLVFLLGSDEIFEVKRIGLDEGYIYDNTGYLKDAHVYRIKGTKKDL